MIQNNCPSIKSSEINIEIPPDLQERYDEYVKQYSYGAEFENKIGNILRNLQRDDCYVLQNLYVPTLDGKTTEIDLILIHSTGIYVFECKDYHAEVESDNPHAKNWNAYYPTEEHFNVYNPARQNERHIQALDNYLHENISFKSWVVFSDMTEMGMSLKQSGFTITEQHRLRRDITTVLNRYGQNSISKENLERIYEKLLLLTQVSKEVKLKHIKDVMIRIILESTFNDSDCAESKISAESLDGLRKAIRKCIERRNNHNPERIRAKPHHSTFYPDTLFVIGILSEIKIDKYHQFYNWVKTLDYRKFSEFCRILLEGNGFSSIRMPEDPQEDCISAQGNGRHYLIKLSNSKGKLSKHNIDNFDSLFGENSTDILIVVTSWSYSPDAISAAKDYGLFLWDCDALRRLMDHIEKNGSCEQKQTLKLFLEKSGYR